MCSRACGLSVGWGGVVARAVSPAVAVWLSPSGQRAVPANRRLFTSARWQWPGSTVARFAPASRWRVSNAAEAVEMRSLIQGWLKKGDSQAQIRHYPACTDYGTSILEKPPASGLNALVWALPAVAGPSAWPGSGSALPAGAAECP